MPSWKNEENGFVVALKRLDERNEARQWDVNELLLDRTINRAVGIRFAFLVCPSWYFRFVAEN